MKRLASLTLLAAAALAAGSCEGPSAGDVTFNLTSPNTNDGAIQFVATAASPDSITGVTAACSGCQVFLARVSATNVHGVVTGDITSGALIHLGVTDVGNTSAYTADVIAAASKTYLIQTGAYSLAAAK